MLRLLLFLAAAAAILVVLRKLVRGRRPAAENPYTRSTATLEAAPEDDVYPADVDGLTTWLLERAGRDIGIPVVQDPLVQMRMRDAAVKALEELGSAESSEINLPYIAADSSGAKHFLVRLERSRLQR
jgi:hypothetical protein